VADQQKYGNKNSCGPDVSLRQLRAGIHGLKNLRFGGGREDVWSRRDVNCGMERTLPGR
jgi:catalase (peroxidase I)